MGKIPAYMVEGCSFLRHIEKSKNTVESQNISITVLYDFLMCLKKIK